MIPKLLAASRLSRPEICSSAAPTMALEHVRAMRPGPALSCHAGFIQLEGADSTHGRQQHTLQEGQQGISAPFMQECQAARLPSTSA